MIKFLWGDKDGGPESKVYCWGLELKSLFSVLLLKFESGSREAFHTHAFNSVSWVIKGELTELFRNKEPNKYPKSLIPILTKRTTEHMVKGSDKPNWVLSFRGPWVNKWKEYNPKTNKNITLTHGRKETT